MASRSAGAAALAWWTLASACQHQAGASQVGDSGSVGDSDSNSDSNSDSSSSSDSNAGPETEVVVPVGDGVAVTLVRVASGSTTVSFGVPLPRGAVTDISQVRVRVGGTPIAANIKELLAFYDATGARTGARALLVQLSSAVLTGDETPIDLVWSSQDGTPPGASFVPFASGGVSADAPSTVQTTVRAIATAGGVNTLTEAAPVTRTLFVGREPRVLAHFPAGYLASVGILGPQVSSAQAHGAGLGALAFLSDALTNFGHGALYDYPYALNPDAESIPDPVAEYEGWLYDRCTTFLTMYVHTNELAFLREAHRQCSYYASKINLSGADRGIFSGKPDPDAKYSHLRGLFAYFALTGSELGHDAGLAIAEMWLADPLVVGPYRQGHLRRSDALWTERLLGTSLEGLVYGHQLTGETQYLTAFKEMFETAYRHIAGDAAALASINPGFAFPPQNCFIHSAEQHAEGDADEPWCSGWMSELVIDPLLAYQAQTGDARVDEVFVRLVRFLRDTGSVYMDANPLEDSFLAPSVCYDPERGEDTRRLIPAYGAGIDASGQRQIYADYSDFEHCADATALTAAGLRALVRLGTYDQNPVGTFASEGASFLQLHHELAFCAWMTFEGHHRPRRDPRVWSSAELAPGVADPAAFIRANKIGYPVWNMAPQRKLSWWFNSSLLEFGLLSEAGVSIQTLTPGLIQPAGCP